MPLSGVGPETYDRGIGPARSELLMPLGERMESVDQARFWKDTIPLRYEYTAGLAGEKFLRGLQEGRLLASRCPKCGTKYMPPKAYCVACYVRIGTFSEVGPVGTVTALAESYVGFDGSRLARPVMFGYITFKGTSGGLVHRVSGKGLAVGSSVSPRFKPKSMRKGSLLDIEEFRVVRG